MVHLNAVVMSWQSHPKRSFQQRLQKLVQFILAHLKKVKDFVLHDLDDNVASKFQLHEDRFC